MSLISNTNMLNDRASLILKYLVEHYILEGHPISSKVLASLPGLGVSSATIRNAVAELEDMGLVAAPHRSAGRIPTAHGLRYYVDYLLAPATPDAQLISTAQERLEPAQTTQHILSTTSQLLSQLTQWVGVVTVPKSEQLILRHIEFLPLSAQKVLAVLVVNDRDVHNRILVTRHAHSASDLQQAANFLNQHFAGKDLFQARQELLQSLEEDRLEADRVMRNAIEIASQAFDTAVGVTEETVLLSGERELLTRVEAGSVHELQRWASAFSEKQQILNLLNDCLLAEGVQIFIGEESGYDNLAQSSLVTANYHINGQPVGVLGIIGPTRMQYEQVIPVVEMTAKLLSSALKSDPESPY